MSLDAAGRDRPVHDRLRDHARQDLLQRGIPAQARPWVERACRNREQEACVAAAEIYLTGRGAPKDDAIGMTWTREACSMGNGEMCFALVAAGLDPPVPETVKPKVYDSACKQGVTSACLH